LGVEIAHKIVIKERREGIEFDSRNHSQIFASREKASLEEYTRGV